MRGFFHLAVCTLLFLSFSACQEDAGTLNLPSELDQDYSLAFTDTTAVITSTVLLDSIPTSTSGSVGALLFGKYQDSKVGLVEAKAYFQVSPSTTWRLAEDAIFDSISLIIQPSGYYYGDKTKSQTIEVREIKEEFKSYNLSQFWINENLYSIFSAGKNKLYNNSQVKINEIETIGTKTFNVENALKDTAGIVVPLNDNLGLSWFEQVKAQSSNFKSTGNFITFFKGLAINSVNEGNIISIVPQRNINVEVGASIVTVNKRSKIRVYYREMVGEVLTNKSYDFSFYGGFTSSTPIYNPDNNFSSIRSDRSGTLIENLTIENNEISSTQTNDETYIQSGTGLATKIKFPSFKNIVNQPGFLKINSVKLILEPVRGSFDQYNNYLPSKLALFYCRANLPLAQVPADYNPRAAQEASTNINLELGTSSGYVFSLTQYFEKLLQDDKVNMKDVALLVTLQPEFMGATVTRAVIGNGLRSNYRARLEIYYLKQNE